MNQKTTRVTWKRVLSLLLCVAVVCALSVTAVQPAQAAYKTSVTNLSFGKRLKGDAYTVTFTKDDIIYHLKVFKFNVPKTGYLTLTNKIPGKLTDNNIFLYKGKNCLATDMDKSINHTCYCSYTKSKTNLIPVSKGVYYLFNMCDSTSKNDWVYYDFTLTFTPLAANTSNTSKQKATKLAPSKSVTVNTLNDTKEAKWYKIVLPKDKSIKITYKDFSQDVRRKALSLSLLNAQGTKVSLKRSGTTYTTAKLKKGTYYIKVNNTGFGVDKLCWN